MLPSSKSEFDQHEDGKNLEEQIHAKQTGHVEHEDDLVDPGHELDGEAEAGLDDDDFDDLGQEAEKKPKKKGMGKGTLIAAVGVAVVVALSGVAYFKLQSPAPVSKKMVVDPSLLESKPTVNAPAAPISSTEVTPNLSTRDIAPIGPLSSSVSNISAPPSDPFNGSVTAPSTSLTPTSTPAVIIAPAPTPAVIIISAPGASVEGPRTDPFGAAVVESVPKPATIEKAPKPIAEPVIKAAKPIKIAKNKDAASDDEVSIVKPRVVKKVVVKKPLTVRKDMTRSEPHPSQESVQPQSSENFSGYEKLF